MYSVSRVVWVSVLILFGGLGFESPAWAQRRPSEDRRLENPFGVKAHLAWSQLHGETFYDEFAIDRSIALMKEIGVGWISFDFSWSTIEMEPGQFDYSHLDPLVSKVHDAGLELLPTLISTPEWASSAEPGADPREMRIHPPRDPAMFGRFVYETVSRYRGIIHSWEIWNEPNNRDFFVSPGEMPDPVDYLRLLRVAYAQAKAADPACQVVLGGLALNGIRRAPDSPTRLTPGWLPRFYLAGGKPFFDVLNIHPYSYPNPVGSHLEQLRETRAVMEAFGDSKKRIWISEVNGDFFNGPNDNATPLNLVFIDLMRENYVDRVFWYNFRNRVPDLEPDLRSDDSGLVTYDLRRKPTYFEFQNLVRVARAWYLERHGRGQQIRASQGPLVFPPK